MCYRNRPLIPHPLSLQLTGLPTEFLEKLAEKMAKSDHMIVGHLATGHKCKSAVKHRNARELEQTLMKDRIALL